MSLRQIWQSWHPKWSYFRFWLNSTASKTRTIARLKLLNSACRSWITTTLEFKSMSTVFCWSSLLQSRISRAFICSVSIQNNPGFTKRRNGYRKEAVSTGQEIMYPSKSNSATLISQQKSMSERCKLRQGNSHEWTTSSITAKVLGDSRAHSQVTNTFRKCTTSAMCMFYLRRRRSARQPGNCINQLKRSKIR